MVVCVCPAYSPRMPGKIIWMPPISNWTTINDAQPETAAANRSGNNNRCAITTRASNPPNRPSARLHQVTNRSGRTEHEVASRARTPTDRQNV